MKRLIFTKMMALFCMMLLWVAKGVAADEITVNPPTITPTSCEYNGTIMPIIMANEGCSIVYVKSTSKVYNSADDIDKNKGVKTENSNKASITDIVGKTGNRYISAYAVKDVNGNKYKSAVVNVTYTYSATAIAKKDLTLSASSIALDMADKTKTATLAISAKDDSGNSVSGLKYRYEVYPKNIVTVNENGVVTPVNAGTASITVIFDGNDNYNAATCVVDVNVASNASFDSNYLVYTSIADIRHAGQSFDNNKHDKCVLDFSNNPAKVIAIMQKHDKDIDDDDKFIGSYFIIDSSNRGLWISAKNMSEKLKVSTLGLAVGSKITGIIVGTYTERTSHIPEFMETGSAVNTKDVTYNNRTYTTNVEVDNSEIGNKDTPPTYPFTEIKDVHTIAMTNKTITDGDIVKSSYGVYLNSIVKVPGTIRKRINKDEIEYYLMQDEKTSIDGSQDNRIYFNSSQIDVNIDDYVGTTGVFEGILVKRVKSEPKLIVLKDDFFKINKIYLDENDDENRIDDLVNAGAFDDEVDVYVHRTKLVNSKGDMWNTICLPFDLTAKEFKKAFGCEISALAAPKVNGDETINDRLTKIGETDNSGNLLFESQSDFSIKEGMPYLIKATGTQTACVNTSILYKNTDGTTKTPQDLMKEDVTYYAAIGQKLITVVPPHQIRGNYNNKIVKGEFFFRGLYGGKTYVDGSTETLIADGGSQKYQYISTTDNYLRYLRSSSTSKFPGLRAYFYFPNWDAAENNKSQGTATSTNSKIHILVDGNTTSISGIDSDTESVKTRIYNLAGQQVDGSYKGIVIKNGRKYVVK